MRNGLINQATYKAIVNANAAGTIPPQNTALGGQVESHGNGQMMDATRGCVGMNDQHIVDLFNRVPEGTRVDIIC